MRWYPCAFYLRTQVPTTESVTPGVQAMKLHPFVIPGAAYKLHKLTVVVVPLDVVHQLSSSSPEGLLMLGTFQAHGCPNTARVAPDAEAAPLPNLQGAQRGL